jgi:hydroxymethylbilane synthase
MTGRSKLRLGTRGSELALTQSSTVADALRAAGHDVELKIIKTAGDRAVGVPFAAIGPQGVFVREIEQALVDGSIDLAVHSFKDLPTTSPRELTIAAVPPRHDPADLLLVRSAALVSSDDAWLPLEHGARVGTASARRRVWLKHFRSDLDVAPLRGNVPTRIRKLKEGAYDAIVLAAAGVGRLRADTRLTTFLEGITVTRLDPQRFVPAPAQGALAVQCRGDDAFVREAVTPLDDAASHRAVAAERAALAYAEGGCDIAFGAYCTSTADTHELIAMHEHRGRVRSARVHGSDPVALAAELWPDFAAAKARREAVR